MLPAQGLKGPVVECVELGSDRPTNRPIHRALRERPMVLVVKPKSHERTSSLSYMPRKSCGVAASISN